MESVSTSNPIPLVHWEHAQAYSYDVIEAIAMGEHGVVYKAGAGGRVSLRPIRPDDAACLSEVGYTLKAGQLEYDCRYSKMHGMLVTGGRGFRDLKPL